MDEKGIMYAAFHRFYGALQNLQKFSVDNNLIDNITSLDNFCIQVYNICSSVFCCSY